MEQYMKATATPFVHHALKDTILKIMESKQSCEVNAYKGVLSLTYSDKSLDKSYFPLPFPLSVVQTAFTSKKNITHAV